MASLEPERTTFTTAKKILERIFKNIEEHNTKTEEHNRQHNTQLPMRWSEAIDNYLEKLSSHDMDLIRRLGDRRNGIQNGFLRTLIKLHYNPAQFAAMERNASRRGVLLNDYGGRKQTRRRRARRQSRRR